MVVLGGLHVSSCPDEAAPHADAIAIGDGVHALAADPARRRARARSQPVYRGRLSRARTATTRRRAATSSRATAS